MAHLLRQDKQRSNRIFKKILPYAYCLDLNQLTRLLTIDMHVSSLLMSTFTNSPYDKLLQRRKITSEDIRATNNHSNPVSATAI